MLSINAAVKAVLALLGANVNDSMSTQDLWNAASNGLAIAPNALGLAADAVPAIPFVLEKSFADGVSGDTVITAPAGFKFRVTGFEIENHGANGSNANTVQLCAAASGASPISNAVSLNGVADKTKVVATSIDYTVGIIAVGANLYLARTKAGGTLTGVARIYGVLTA